MLRRLWKSLMRQYGGTVEANVVFEQNIYTEARLSELTKNLLLGSLVVMAVGVHLYGHKGVMDSGSVTAIVCGFCDFFIEPFLMNKFTKCRFLASLSLSVC